jgi:phosphatidylserine/phosphatidylglycerophosphate/cardiolipin synthase-like enzyme
VQYVGGNRLTLLKNGEQYFPALLEAIDAARATFRSAFAARWRAPARSSWCSGRSPRRC